MTTTDDDLMACPHCGAAAHTIFKPPDGIEIRCAECSARTVSAAAGDLAAADWNSVADDPDDPGGGVICGLTAGILASSGRSRSRSAGDQLTKRRGFFAGARWRRAARAPS